MQFRSFICAFFRLFRDLITSCSFLIDILNWVTRINLLSPFLQLDRFLLNNSAELSIINETLILIIAEKNNSFMAFSRFSIKLKASERRLKSFEDCLRR